MAKRDMVKSSKWSYLRGRNPEPYRRTRIPAIKFEILADNIIAFDYPLPPNKRLVRRLAPSDENRFVGSSLAANDDTVGDVRSMNLDDASRRKALGNGPTRPGR